MKPMQAVQILPYQKKTFKTQKPSQILTCTPCLLKADSSSSGFCRGARAVTKRLQLPCSDFSCRAIICLESPRRRAGSEMKGSVCIVSIDGCRIRRPFTIRPNFKPWCVQVNLPLSCRACAKVRVRKCRTDCRNVQSISGLSAPRTSICTLEPLLYPNPPGTLQTSTQLD